ncbi:hypothetical protein BD324DRAFT_650889 [Kockovaella imperatae]|uniref:RNase III domain-containing protein n=1 Tax=Kockovaella imperatae TaxID=4999 RepID=A0A1Y1UJI5_9TREE|nr:hypothetical protein BD324DRAFT_650889 [Kockovaella imperatae]ORX37285.1 hypothetical protein BD324DRAFT_650889 [Kockovaella imperatae]
MTDSSIITAQGNRPLPPLPEFPLPPLLQVQDEELKAVATTHTSFYALRRDRHDWSMTQRVMDYEKLEHVGDGLLGSCVVLLLHEMFPNLREGPATILKGDLICNETLAQLADRYGISVQLRTSPAAFYATRNQVKTRASLFEAWIAAVYYSFLQHGPPDIHSEPNLIECSPRRTSSPVKGQPTSTESRQEKSRRKLINKARQDIHFKRAREEVSSASSDTSSDTTSDTESSGDESDSESSSKVAAALTFPTLTPGPPEVTSSFRPSQYAHTTSTVTTDHQNSKSSKKGDQDLRGSDDDVVTGHTCSDGQAFENLYQWFKEAFRPIAKFALQVRIDEQAKNNNITSVIDQAQEDHTAIGAKCAVDLFSKDRLGVDPVYTAVRPEGIKGIWLVTCTITEKNGRAWTAEALRSTKKFGYNLAAFRVGKQLQFL